eukprot:3198555-Rhodomonas_salina.1
MTLITCSVARSSFCWKLVHTHTRHAVSDTESACSRAPREERGLGEDWERRERVRGGGGEGRRAGRGERARVRCSPRAWSAGAPPLPTTAKLTRTAQGGGGRAGYLVELSMMKWFGCADLPARTPVSYTHLRAHETEADL